MTAGADAGRRVATRVRATASAWLERPLVRRAAIAAVTLLGLALRLDAARRWNWGRPNSAARLFGDEPSYDGLAIDLLGGFGITWPGRVPLYPLWLAAMHWLGGDSYNFITYAQAFLGTTTVPLTYLLGRRLFGTGAAILAAALVATSWTLVKHCVLLQSEVLFTPILILGVIKLYDALEGAAARRRSPREVVGTFVIAGTLVGVSDLIRPTLFAFPAFAALAAIMRLGIRRGLRLAVVYGLAAMLVIAPWTVHNWRRYHVFLPLATSNAVLWLGSPEYYHLTRHQGYTYMDVWTKVLVNRHDDAPEPGNIEGEGWWRSRALRSIRAEPLTYLRFAAEKLGTYWLGDSRADYNDTHVLNYRVLREWKLTRFATAQILIIRLLIVPAIVAAFILRRRWRELLAVYAVIVYCALLHAATHAEARLSEPLQPLLYALIAGGIVAVVRRLVSRRTAPTTQRPDCFTATTPTTA